MQVTLGEFTWQEIIQHQDQGISLEFVGYKPIKGKPRTIRDFKWIADRKGRVMALPTHLPYIKQHYKEVTFDKRAVEQIREFHKDFTV